MEKYIHALSIHTSIAHIHVPLPRYCIICTHKVPDRFILLYNTATKTWMRHIDNNIGSTNCVNEHKNNPVSDLYSAIELEGK